MLKSNIDLCPACSGEKKVKVIKNIIQIGPYHLGKEKFEKCKFCEVFVNHDFNTGLIISKYRQI